MDGVGVVGALGLETVENGGHTARHGLVGAVVTRAAAVAVGAVVVVVDATRRHDGGELARVDDAAVGHLAPDGVDGGYFADAPAFGG